DHDVQALSTQRGDMRVLPCGRDGVRTVGAGGDRQHGSAPRTRGPVVSAQALVAAVFVLALHGVFWAVGRLAGSVATAKWALMIGQALSDQRSGGFLLGSALSLLAGLFGGLDFHRCRLGGRRSSDLGDQRGYAALSGLAVGELLDGLF